MQFKLFSIAAAVLTLGMALGFLASILGGSGRRAAAVASGAFTLAGMGLMIGAAGTLG
jgi:hypothetical protein